MEEYRYQKLIVWQRAVALASEVHRATAAAPRRRVAGLADQMRRAALSIPANIAEGNSRRHRADYLRFLAIAAGSLAELETHVEIARRLELFPIASLVSITNLATETARLLTRLMQSLRKPER